MYAAAVFPIDERGDLSYYDKRKGNCPENLLQEAENMGKFVIKDTKNGVKFDLKAGNGEIILTSEVYSTLRGCKNGIASVGKNAPAAALEDQTVEGRKKEKCPKFEVYTDKAGEFRFRLKATNGQIIGVGEGYKKKESCLNGIESIRKNAADAKLEDARAQK